MNNQKNDRQDVYEQNINAEKSNEVIQLIIEAQERKFTFNGKNS